MKHTCSTCAMLAILTLAPLFSLASPPTAPIGAREAKVARKVPPRRPSAELITRKGEGGTILLLNRSSTKSPSIVKTAEKIQTFCRVSVESRVDELSTETNGLQAAMQALSGKGEVAIVILISNEGKDKPLLAAYPDDRMAVINMDRLQDGKADSETVDARLESELWRAVAFVTGGYASDFPCALKPIASVEGLDSNPVRMACPPVCGKISQAAKLYGIATVQVVPYGVAVAQGWAPAPTNDLQKAIWDRVKAEQAKVKVEK